MNEKNLNAQIAALLERSGVDAQEAARIAGQAVTNLMAAGPGTGWGHLTPGELPAIWERAARAGRRRLVLEIACEEGTLEDDTGRVNVTVLAADTWPEWTPGHTARRAAADAMLAAPALPTPAGWEVFDTSVEDDPEVERDRARTMN